MSIPATLPDLAERINVEHAACLEARDACVASAQDAIARATNIGKWLGEAKGQVPHGKWSGWVEVNCTFGIREAQRYMQVYRNRETLDSQTRHGVSHLDSLRDALAVLAEPKAESGELARHEATIGDGLPVMDEMIREIGSLKAGLGDPAFDTWVKSLPPAKRVVAEACAGMSSDCDEPESIAEKVNRLHRQITSKAREAREGLAGTNALMEEFRVSGGWKDLGYETWDAFVKGQGWDGLRHAEELIASIGGPDIKIDPEFSKLLPPLKPREFADLEASILKWGCTQPLAVWAEHNILLDGHARLAICRKHGVDFRTAEIELENRDQAAIYIYNCQLLRHNLTDDQIAAVELQAREAMAARNKAGAN
jgi:Protein of unknown function (DUF3102)